MQDQLNLDPTPLRRLAPELPEEMESVVQKCIAKDPSMRYKSMDDVMKDLRLAVEIAKSHGG
jgi:serine/threonine-protein kinase